MPVPESALAFISSLIARARPLQKRIVFPEGSDPRVQAAAERLAREGIVQPILIGARASVPGVKFVDPAASGNVRKYASLLYERRRARGMTQLEAAQIAVELDGNVAPRERWCDILISPGATLEIVRFVGGG